MPAGDNENLLYRFVIDHGDFVADEDAAPTTALFLNAPDYKRTIRAGKDARHLWVALRDWRGDDPEDYFGDLGAWAEKGLRSLV
ncbi:hypothetical protein F4802DRAFT_596650 [Xylaria palmicola]|nr:hypothetical protein F4802DRAFT_596650 [Xylaria palmicola]